MNYELPDIPLIDLKQQYLPLHDEVIKAFEQILKSQQFINGPAVKELENDVENALGAKHAIGVSSGSDALLCALMALDVQPGDEIIIPSFTFFATAGAISRLGAKPVFVDIQTDTFNIDPNSISAAVTPRTVGMIPVHLFGQMAEMSPLLDIAQKHHLWILEDAAQAIGATQNGKQAGTLGEAGALSFFPTKNLGGAGDGGMILTSNDDLAKTILSLRNHGMEPKYYHSKVGGNFRLDTLQAAYLKVKLPYLEQWSGRRRENGALYNQLLSDIEQIATPTIAPGNTSIYNQYVIRAQRRDDLKKYLAEHHIGSEVYYPVALHQQECFAELGYKRGDFPQSERAADEVLALPIYPELSEKQIQRVAGAIADFYNQK